MVKFETYFSFYKFLYWKCARHYIAFQNLLCHVYWQDSLKINTFFFKNNVLVTFCVEIIKCDFFFFEKWPECVYSLLQLYHSNGVSFLIHVLLFHIDNSPWLGLSSALPKGTLMNYVPQAEIKAMTLMFPCLYVFEFNAIWTAKVLSLWSVMHLWPIMRKRDLVRTAKSTDLGQPAQFDLRSNFSLLADCVFLIIPLN